MWVVEGVVERNMCAGAPDTVRRPVVYGRPNRLLAKCGSLRPCCLIREKAEAALCRVPALMGLLLRKQHLSCAQISAPGVVTLLFSPALPSDSFRPHMGQSVECSQVPYVALLLQE